MSESAPTLTFTEAARAGLAEEMERDPSIFVVGEGIGPRGGNFNTTLGLYERFGPRRVRDTPITERGFIGMCTGAAMVGARPVVDFMFLDFILDAFGELINQIAKIQYMSSGRIAMPMVLRGCIGIGGSAATHHSGNYYPFFAHQPGFRVVVPSTPHDAKGLLKTAIRSDDPVLFLEHKLLMATKGPVPTEEYLEPIGKAKVRTTGNDATVVTVGAMVQRTLDAVSPWSEDGLSIEVVDLVSISPLDISTILESVSKTGRLLIVDEDYEPCGIGAEICARIVKEGFDFLDAPIARLNGAQAPIPYSPVLEKAVVPSKEDITSAVLELLAQ